MCMHEYGHIIDDRPPGPSYLSADSSTGGTHETRPPRQHAYGEGDTVRRITPHACGPEKERAADEEIGVRIFLQ